LCTSATPQGNVALGKALSIEKIAEVSLLRGGQGLLCARPLDAVAAEAFLREWALNAAGQGLAGPAGPAHTQRVVAPRRINPVLLFMMVAGFR
jgi:hypothetical protein